MANELSIRATRNKTGYFVARRQSTGQTCIPGTPSTFEQEVVAHWSTYAVTATESDHANGGTGLYQANMPASVPADIINYDFFFQAGDSPAIGDGPEQGSGWVNWTGSADVISTIDVAGVRSAVGLASANLDAQLAEIEADIDLIPTNPYTGTIAQIAAAILRTPAHLLATDASGYVTLTAAGLDQVQIENGLNMRQAMSIGVAALAGVLSGAAGTSVVMLGAGVVTQRIAATVDPLGNRVTVTLSPPA